MLRHLKRPELPIEVVASYVGDGAPMLVRRALGDPQDEAVCKSALEYFMLYYREHKLDHTYVYPGVLDTLKAIRERSDLQMAVLTNKPSRPFARHLRWPGALGFYVADLWRQQLSDQEARSARGAGAAGGARRQAHRGDHDRRLAERRADRQQRRNVLRRRHLRAFARSR